MGQSVALQNFNTKKENEQDNLADPGNPCSWVKFTQGVLIIRLIGSLCSSFSEDHLSHAIFFFPKYISSPCKSVLFETGPTSHMWQLKFNLNYIRINSSVTLVTFLSGQEPHVDSGQCIRGGKSRTFPSSQKVPSDSTVVSGTWKQCEWYATCGKWKHQLWCHEKKKKGKSQSKCCQDFSWNYPWEETWPTDWTI